MQVESIQIKPSSISKKKTILSNLIPPNSNNNLLDKENILEQLHINTIVPNQLITDNADIQQPVTLLLPYTSSLEQQQPIYNSSPESLTSPSQNQLALNQVDDSQSYYSTDSLINDYYSSSDSNSQNLNLNLSSAVEPPNWLYPIDNLPESSTENLTENLTEISTKISLEVSTENTSENSIHQILNSNQNDDCGQKILKKKKKSVKFDEVTEIFQINYEIIFNWKNKTYQNGDDIIDNQEEDTQMKVQVFNQPINNATSSNLSKRSSLYIPSRNKDDLLDFDDNNNNYLKMHEQDEVNKIDSKILSIDDETFEFIENADDDDEQLSSSVENDDYTDEILDDNDELVEYKDESLETKVYEELPKDSEEDFKEYKEDDDQSLIEKMDFEEEVKYSYNNRFSKDVSAKNGFIEVKNKNDFENIPLPKSRELNNFNTNKPVLSKRHSYLLGLDLKENNNINNSNNNRNSDSLGNLKKKSSFLKKNKKKIDNVKKVNVLSKRHSMLLGLEDYYQEGEEKKLNEEESFCLNTQNYAKEVYTTKNNAEVTNNKLRKRLSLIFFQKQNLSNLNKVSNSSENGDEENNENFKKIEQFKNKDALNINKKKSGGFGLFKKKSFKNLFGSK
ncbi:hypothetical protein HK099_001165 [Clydaea vesicula]|uniref:Uncharacterized protein n=1 Tax=Clydaea vesicula TaxID=447962 RepID=A0AAD5TWM4_9FUNG|nr:hypothetical protein HK099_001165 [Clydaea vesicula]